MEDSMLRFVFRSSASFAALALFATPALAGPVVVDSQTRSVHVAIPSIVDGEPSIDEAVTAPDNNPFNQTLDRTLSQLEETNHALASQNSSFGEAANVFTATSDGQTNYSATGITGIVFSEQEFILQFTLDDTRDYSLDGSGSFVDTSGGASNFAVTLVGPGGTVASFTKADFDPGLNDGTLVTPNFATSGTLTPGAYTLTALSGVSGGTNSNEIQASSVVNFTATAQGGGAVIPLPVGVAPGMVMLSSLGLIAARRRFAGA
jgi:hypothetical protein